MDSMDLKGIAWVGNVYQKFETMCLEVEETMYQETAKYVENQVQTVGASMKRFYSDVMQDLHPPSSVDNVKVAATDSLPNPYTDVGVLKKTKEKIKEHSKKNVQITGLSVENSSPPNERLSLSNEIPKAHSRLMSIGEASHEGEVVCDQVVEISPLALVESSVRKGEEANETCGDCRLISQVGSHSSGDTQHGRITNEAVYMSHTGDGNVGKIENDETQDLRMKMNGEDPMSKLEEACVLVVGENVDFESTSSQRKNKSYKKKIRKAFSLKLKSGREQEYEQLAAEHVNSITRSNLESAETETPTLVMNSNSFKDFSESEWELL